MVPSYEMYIEAVPNKKLSNCSAPSSPDPEHFEAIGLLLTRRFVLNKAIKSKARRRAGNPPVCNCRCWTGRRTPLSVFCEECSVA